MTTMRTVLPATEEDVEDLAKRMLQSMAQRERMVRAILLLHRNAVAREEQTRDMLARV